MPTLKRRLEQLEQKVDPEPLVIKIIFGREGFGPVTYGPTLLCGGIPLSGTADAEGG